MYIEHYYDVVKTVKPSKPSSPRNTKNMLAIVVEWRKECGLGALSRVFAKLYREMNSDNLKEIKNVRVEKIILRAAAAADDQGKVL